MEEKKDSSAINKIWAVYFSPTGGTKTAATLLAGMLGERLGLPVEEIDFTSPAARESTYHFGVSDLVVAASPVYAGRMPNKIMPDWKRCFCADGAIAVPVVVFGNRSYGGALTELRVILQEAGFRVIAGAALVSRHAFTDALASGRPDDADREEICAFADGVALKVRKLQEGDETVQLPALSEEDIPPYYTPLKEDGTPAKFLKAKPETDADKCDLCGICMEVCPVGSINDKMQAEGVCIKCQACVRKCPEHAKYFTDGDFLSHVRMLEKNYTARAQNLLLF